MAIKASCVSASFAQPNTVAAAVEIQKWNRRSNNKITAVAATAASSSMIKGASHLSVCVFCVCFLDIRTIKCHTNEHHCLIALWEHMLGVVVSNFQHIFARFLRFDYCFIITFVRSLSLSCPVAAGRSFYDNVIIINFCFVLFCSSSFYIGSPTNLPLLSIPSSLSLSFSRSIRILRVKIQ